MTAFQQDLRVTTAADDKLSDCARGLSLLASQEWDGRPGNPDRSSWYWLVRQNGPDLRHAVWLWCDQCHQWEAEPGLSFSAEQTTTDGWRVLAATASPDAAASAGPCPVGRRQEPA